VPLFTSGGLGLGLVIFGLGLKNLVLFTLLIVIGVDYVVRRRRFTSPESAQSSYFVA